MSIDTFFSDLSKQTENLTTYRPSDEEQRINISYVQDVIDDMQTIAGEWNGDEPGQAEDRATCALEIIEQAEKLQLMLSDLGSL